MDLLYCFTVYFFPDLYKDMPERIRQRIVVGHLFITLFLIPFYYFNTQVLIPKLLFKAKWWWYSIIIIACFITFLYVPKWLGDLTLSSLQENKTEIKKNAPVAATKDTVEIQNKEIQSPPKPPNQQFRNGPPNRNFVRWRFYPPAYTVFLLIYTIGTCIALMQRWLHTERTNQEIQNEKLNTELSFLKSQINPHFFFNTLNNIYSLAVVRSEQTATAVLKLSSIMRYILTETQVEEVALPNEVEFIKNFIDLQLVRLTDKVTINFICEGNIEDKKIAPLMFIPFIENAFKYGVSTKEKTSIEIRLSANPESVSLFVSNTIVKADNGIHDTTGIGINNVKRRLELLYPDRYSLDVKDDGNQFIVQLDIKTT